MKGIIPVGKGLFAVFIGCDKKFRLFFVESVKKTEGLIFITGWFFKDQNPPFDTALTVLKIPNDEDYFFEQPTLACIRFFKKKLEKFLTQATTTKTIEHINVIIWNIS